MEYIGEVLITSTTQFTAQAVKINNSPAFGSFVKTVSGGVNIYGIVYNVATGSIDGNRKPMAFGKQEEVLFKEQPQLSHLLKTEFSALTIGYRKEKYYGYLPDNPPRIHSFVHVCSEEEVLEITEDLSYLQTLISNNLGNQEQLVSASIRFGVNSSNNTKEFLIKTGKCLLPLLKYDMDSFNNIFRSVR